MKKKQELMTRVVTAAIYVGIMIIFILPGLWVPMIPLILIAAVTFLSAFEKEFWSLRDLLLVPYGFIGYLSGLSFRNFKPKLLFNPSCQFT